MLQNEILNLKQQRFVWGTVKAAVLVGDPGCPNLIASSVYDTKPVNYLSMVSDKIEWVVKSKPVFNVKTNETKDLQFLRLNQINKYNNEMGGVDIADQLRGVYRKLIALLGTASGGLVSYSGALGCFSPILI